MSADRVDGTDRRGNGSEILRKQKLKCESFKFGKQTHVSLFKIRPSKITSHVCVCVCRCKKHKRERKRKNDEGNGKLHDKREMSHS